jgi:hypothetical protein
VLERRTGGGQIKRYVYSKGLLRNRVSMHVRLLVNRRGLRKIPSLDANSVWQDKNNPSSKETDDKSRRKDNIKRQQAPAQGSRLFRCLRSEWKELWPVKISFSNGQQSNSIDIYMYILYTRVDDYEICGIPN